ncbi:tRNA(adenine34) deaminase [Polyrhizophydium stewartii]|uniref:tRNA(Adenine34) deaminase n=1 Tax=Polyrhizophydium stewartii TaxID=2732419 RepID=A0ABR4N1J8_9FUNG
MSDKPEQAATTAAGGFTAAEQTYMRQALALAEEAYAVGEVPVGCVFVHDELGVVGQGRNRTNETLNGTRHAEFEAIDQILALRPAGTPLADFVRDTFARTDLFVTVEPCVMCASALRKLGLRRAVYGCGNDKFGGCGSVFTIHTDEVGEGSKYEAVGGLFRGEAIMALRRFYVRENDHAPAPKRKGRRVLKTTFD